jgi:hypothetical protein
MKTISLIAIVCFSSIVVNGFTLQGENKYDKLISGLLEKLKQNKTAFNDFYYFHGKDFRRGFNKFNSLTIRDTNLLGLEDAVARTGAQGRQRGTDEIYISPAVISIPTVKIDGLMDIETEDGSEYTVPFVSKQVPEGVDIKMSLTFDKKSKDIMANNMGYSVQHPRFTVQLNCTAVENLPLQVCEDAEQFSQIVGFGRIDGLVAMRFISVVQSTPWDF